MQLFTAAHSNHEKCSLLSVSSPHNTDLSIKSKRYWITKGHPVKLIMIRGPVNRANTSKFCSFKKKNLNSVPFLPLLKMGGFYMQYSSGVYWPGRTRLFQRFSTAADAVGNTSLLSHLHHRYSFQHCHLPLLWNSSVYLGTVILFSWLQDSFLRCKWLISIVSVNH